MKLSKNVKIVMLTVLILLIGVITVGIVSGNKVDASITAPTCDSCGNAMVLDSGYYTSKEHRYICADCNTYKSESHVNTSPKLAIDNNDKLTHSWQCNVCQKKAIENHSMAEKYEEEDMTTNSHKKTHYCKWCTYSYVEDSSFSHTGGNHGNGGKCTVCDYQYQTHKIDTTKKVGGRTLTGGGAHVVLYACSYDGCESTYEGGSEGCTYKFGDDGTDEKCATGTCTLCGYERKPTNHSWLNGKCSTCGETQTSSGGGGSTCSHNYERKTDANNHWEACSKCGAEKSGSKEKHKEGSHTNGGKCTVCEYVYQKHEKSTEVKEYKKTETGHTPIYKCTESACTETYEGTEEKHTGATHEKGGKCTVCEYVYQKHEKSTEVKEYKKTETGHTPIYKCTDSTCTETYEGTEEKHTGATHENGGKCTVCEFVYQKHEKSDEVTEYKNTKTGHTPVYKCTELTCTEKYEGTEEKHNVEKWTDKENGTHSGLCKICNYEVLEEHEYKDGKCDKCNAVENKEEEECKHSYVVKNNKNEHWEECSKCGEVKKGTLESHEFKKYTDNEDGTHSSTCSVCEYKITEAHNYENNKCKECDSSKPEEKCEHTYVTKSNATYHWEECSKCGETKEESKEKHKHTTYTDNEDGTHSSTCSVCKYKLTEKHNYENDKCSYCSAEKTDSSENKNDGDNKNDNGNKNDTNKNDDNKGDNKSNNSNNNNNSSSNGKKDDSTIKEEIPKAGKQNIIMILIAVLSLGVVVTVLKIRKYKDI